MLDMGRALLWTSSLREDKPTKDAKNMTLNTFGDNLLYGTSRRLTNLMLPSVPIGEEPYQFQMYNLS